jgi:four helix bundle protein
MDMETNSLDSLRIYQIAEVISDYAWQILQIIPKEYKKSTGRQFLESSDSVGANIAEGYGRFTYKERIYYCRIARGSLYETRFWFSLLCKRFNIKEEVQNEFRKHIKNESILINKYITYLKTKSQGPTQ